MCVYAINETCWVVELCIHAANIDSALESIGIESNGVGTSVGNLKGKRYTIAMLH